MGSGLGMADGDGELADGEEELGGTGGMARAESLEPNCWRGI